MRAIKFLARQAQLCGVGAKALATGKVSRYVTTGAIALSTTTAAMASGAGSGFTPPTGLDMAAVTADVVTANKNLILGAAALIIFTRIFGGAISGVGWGLRKVAKAK